MSKSIKESWDEGRNTGSELHFLIQNQSKDPLDDYSETPMKCDDCLPNPMLDNEDEWSNNGFITFDVVHIFDRTELYPTILLQGG